MQGTFRYLLAHLVVLGHLWPGTWSHPVAHPGVYAVFAFYLLSGHLMALTLSRTYAFTPRGTVRFLANRALRIHPPYLAVLAATAVLLAWQPGISLPLNGFLALPDSGTGWLRNLAIFGLDGGFFRGGADPRRLIPPAWSLDVELCFYVAMGLLLGRGRIVAFVWLLVSVAYTVLLWVGEASWVLRYTPVAAASLPFSLGAVLYHWRAPLIRRLDAGVDGVATRLRIAQPALRGGLAVAASALFVLHALAADRVWSDPTGAGFYASLLLSVAALLCLGALRREELSGRVIAVDRLLGALAYPVFLCHWLVALVVSAVAFDGVHPGGATLFWSSLLLVNGVAWGLHAAVERPLERLRDEIRPHPRPAAQAAAEPRTEALPS